MTFISRAALAFTLAAALPGAAFAGDPNGVWLRDNGNSKVRIGPCGNALCGNIVWLRDANAPAHVGQRVFFDMTPSGENSWSGRAFNPEDGRTYSGKMTLAGNSLTTSGCVLGGLFCKTVHWSRTK